MWHEATVGGAVPVVQVRRPLQPLFLAAVLAEIYLRSASVLAKKY
jgi:hypothetical protein